MPFRPRLSGWLGPFVGLFALLLSIVACGSTFAALAVPLTSATGYADSGNHGYSLSSIVGPSVTSIAGTGTAADTGDDGEVDVSIGFDFRFFSTVYSDVQVNGNGHIYMGIGYDPSDNYTGGNGNSAHPEDSGGVIRTNYNGPRVDFGWDDWNVGDDDTTGGIFTETRGTVGSREFVVEYEGVAHFGTASIDSIQMILHEDTNNITFNYVDTDGPFDNGFAIGIQGSDSTYFQYGYFDGPGTTGVGKPDGGESLLYTAPTGPPTLQVFIDRDTGNVLLENNTGANVDIKGYSIRSAAGVFDETEFTSLDDASTAGWVQLTQPGAGTDLSEGHLTTASLPNGTSLDLGNAWLPYFEDQTDITFTFLDGNGDAVQALVEFSGNGDASFEYLDLNFDGTIDPADWTEFKSNYGSDLTDKTVAQAYRLSDLTNDGVHDLLDVNEFRRAYNEALGAGSFALAVSSVPEPSTVVLFALAGSLLLGFRNRSSFAKSLRSGNSMKTVVAFVAVALVSLSFTSSAVAQQVFFEDFEGLTLIDSDQASDGDDETDWNTVADSGLGALGWTMDSRSTPADVTEPLNNEFLGWTVWDFAFWLDEEGPQVGRDQFLPGLQPNNTMIGVDPDAHDDIIGVGATGFTAILRSPVIDISGINANSLVLTFNETWAEEDIQEAIGSFIIDGSPTEFLHYTSAGGDPNFFQPDLLNNTVVVNIPNDPSDSTLQITWDMPQAGNDWFWGLDNIAINGLPTLQVDTADGDLAIVGGATAEIFAYEITSASGLLDPTSWTANNLDAEDFDADGPGVGEAWETVGGTDEQLVEAFLLGATPFLSGVVEPIGTGFDFAAAGGTEDLIFRITTADGTVLTGLVEYTTGVPTNVVSTAVAGDYSGNGIVDAEDYTIWRDNLGASDESAFAPGTGNGGGVDATDYTFWKGNFGNTSGSGSLATAEVPEPTSIVLVAGLGLLLLGARRR